MIHNKSYHRCKRGCRSPHTSSSTRLTDDTFTIKWHQIQSRIWSSCIDWVKNFKEKSCWQSNSATFFKADIQKKNKVIHHVQHIGEANGCGASRLAQVNFMSWLHIKWQNFLFVRRKYIRTPLSYKMILSSSSLTPPVMFYIILNGF